MAVKNKSRGYAVKLGVGSKARFVQVSKRKNRKTRFDRKQDAQAVARVTGGVVVPL